MKNNFARRIIGTFGEAGAAWLEKLPDLLKQAAGRWQLELHTPFAAASYNYVLPAVRRGGEPVVLKAGVPNPELTSEIEALRHFEGQGAVRLLEADADAGLLLLERAQPGMLLLREKDDAAATRIFAGILKRLHKPASAAHSFPATTDWAQGFARLRERFEGTTGPIPEATVDRAERMMAELHTSMSAAVVLHGDLHHWNILSAGREPWLAIDPKGVIGEPEYEVGAWLRNPFPRMTRGPEFSGLMSRRLDVLRDELGFSRTRMLSWAYSQAVLSGIWSLEEDAAEWQGWLAGAEGFAGLMGR